ncbi:MAG: LysR family transcriptional regulator [Desulfuromonas sp.]|nr:LysR family transcriptional regulator [Desulfuromonas sp.]
METQYLRTLVMAAQEGSFSKAAIKLNVTQSAVSQRTKSLESCCGVKLLDRSGAIIQPTVAGRVAIDCAQRILKLEEQMLRELRSLTDKQHLYICCTPAFGVAHLPQIVRSFTQENSSIDELMFLFDAPLQALDGLRAGEFDVAIIEHLPNIDFGGIRHLDLPDDEMVFVSAPSLEIPAGEVALSQLQQHSFIIRRAGCSCRDLLSLNLEAAGSDIDLFRKVMVLDDFNLISDEVLAGSGVTFISRSVVAKYLAAGTLREHRVAGFEHYRQRSIVSLACESPTSLKRMFMETVMRYFNIEMLA